MLSTLAGIATKSGAFGRLAVTQRCLPALQDRTISFDSKASMNEIAADIQKKMARWEAANEIYYGKDRDKKNFPIYKFAESCPPVRLGVIPASWFTALYNKTGVSGPYLFFGGLTATLFSKEYLVMDHGMMEFMLYFPTLWVLVYLLKDPANAWFDKIEKRSRYLRYTKPIEDAKSKVNTVIDVKEKDLWRKEGQKYVFDGMKENIGLQLEAIYRQRTHEVYTQVKKRLDYQLELQNARRRFEQENMVNWITKNVIASITPKQEKETLSSCIQTLKRMSQQAAV